MALFAHRGATAVRRYLLPGPAGDEFRDRGRAGRRRQLGAVARHPRQGAVVPRAFDADRGARSAAPGRWPTRTQTIQGGGTSNETDDNGCGWPQRRWPRRCCVAQPGPWRRSAAARLRVGISQMPPTPDPVVTTFGINWMTSVVACEPLFGIDTSWTPQPMLADASLFSDDGTELTITLRDGLTFQSGAGADLGRRRGLAEPLPRRRRHRRLVQGGDRLDRGGGRPAPCSSS